MVTPVVSPSSRPSTANLYDLLPGELRDCVQEKGKFNTACITPPKVTTVTRPRSPLGLLDVVTVRHNRLRMYQRLALLPPPSPSGHPVPPMKLIIGMITAMTIATVDRHLANTGLLPQPAIASPPDEVYTARADRPDQAPPSIASIPPPAPATAPIWSSTVHSPCPPARSSRPATRGLRGPHHDFAPGSD